MFSDDYIHLGGDEISFDCLNELPSILQWMQTHLNSSNYQDLIAYHLNQSVPNVLGAGKKAVFWQEVFTMVLSNPSYNLPIKPGNSVVQVWFGGQDYYKLIESAVTMGFETLMSYGWYLDQQNPSITGSSHYLFQDTWLDFYAVDPMTGLDNLTEAQQSLILGGEASQWGETAHPYAIDENVWPRAAATAEKLWSPRSSTQNSDEAYHRFIRHQCRLVQRGVRASSFRPNFCPSPLLDSEIPSAQRTHLFRFLLRLKSLTECLFLCKRSRELCIRSYLGYRANCLGYCSFRRHGRRFLPSKQSSPEISTISLKLNFHL